MIKIKRILFPTDFSDFSKHALKYAKAFAREFEAKLYVLHVMEYSIDPSLFYMKYFPMELPLTDYYKKADDETKKELEALVSDEERKAYKIETVVVQGSPFQEIIQFAESAQIDLITIATHGRTGISHTFFGSTAEKVVRKAPCPVLSIRHPEHDFVNGNS